MPVKDITSGVPGESPRKGAPTADTARYRVQPLEQAASVVPTAVVDRVDVLDIDGKPTGEVVEIPRTEYVAGPLVALVQVTIRRADGSIVQHTGTAASVKARCAIDAEPRDRVAIEGAL